MASAPGLPIPIANRPLSSRDVLGLHCPFCGVNLELDLYIENRPRTCPWLREVRGIFLSDHRPSLTGVGVILPRLLCAPVSSEFSYREVKDDAETKLVRIALLGYRGETPRSREAPWGYGFHDGCWRLLLARLSHFDQADIVDFVFTFLYHTPLSSFEHPGRSELLSHCFADPWAIPSLSELERCAQIPSPASKKTVDICSSSPEGLGSLFGSLPIELIYLILSYLSSSQVAQVRLVCRELAQVAKLDNLSPSFWKSRFRHGSEQAYLCADLSIRRNWRQLFLGANTCLKQGNLRVINRKRIWGLLEPIAVLMEDAESTKLQGLPVSLADTDKGQYQLLHINSADLPTAFTTICSFSGQLPPDGYNGYLLGGCRVQGYRVAQFPSQFSEDGGKVRVSTVRVGVQRYISGIKISSLLPSDLSQIGLCNLSQEKSIEIPPFARIKIIEVAFCTSGLVGIRFLFTGHHSSEWVGQADGEGIGRGILSLPADLHAYYLVAGVDPYKIVTLGLVQPDEERPDRPPEDSMSSFIQSHLWIPQTPTHKGLVISPVVPARDSFPFEPFLDMDFGGPQGTHLASLTRIVAHMVSGECPIIGMEFFYGDNKRTRFGSGGESEISFLIDGPGGERIIGVEISIDQPAWGMCSLKISTSFGRTTFFGTVRCQSRIASRPQWSPRLPEGYIITGFVAAQLENERYFARLGLQGQLIPSRTEIVTTAQDNHAYHLSEKQVQRNIGSAIYIYHPNFGVYGTYALLTGLRRIQASTGLPGRSRLPRHISGLRFDYHDARRSAAIVGQWMDAQDDMIIDISQGEELQALMIRRSRDTRPAYITGSQGPVVEIKIETTKRQRKVFKSPHYTATPADYDACMSQQFRSGELYGAIMAISWILNSAFDGVQAIYRIG